MIRIIASVALMFTVAACAGSVPWNDQNVAGVTDVHLNWCPVGAAPAADFKLCDVSWRDGKEKQAVHLAADLVAGKIDYSASAVAAFNGQAARADIEKAVAAQVGTAIGPGGVATIVDAVMKAIGAP